MQTKIFLLLLTVLLLAVFAPSLSDEEFTPLENIELFKSKIKTMAETTLTIESDFIQEKHLSMLEEVLVSKGYFCYKKEDKVRWEYLTPIQYLIVVNNGEFTIKDGKKVSKYDIHSNRIFKEINDMILHSIQGSILENNDFTISYFENPGLYLAKLVPNKKEVREMLQTINIYFDKKDLSVSQIKMDEASGDFTSIKFINKKLNEDIPNTKFIAN